MAPLLATYRIQLRKEFGFNEACEIIPYLARLGISHLYTSPILAAAPGSTHGYNMVDPSEANPELGGDEGRRRLSETLAQQGLGHLLDIVPNHMGTGHANRYWEDVLSRGRESQYARWFDVDWEAPGEEQHNRVMVPILGDELEQVVGRGEIKIVRNGHEPRLQYFDHSLPLHPDTTRDLPPDAESWSGQGDGGARLIKLIRDQQYLLTPWQRSATDLNYRRFFDVSELAALRIEDPAVFSRVHQRVLEWVARGEVHGLRVDHIDGLRNPREYLERLRAAVDPVRPNNDDGTFPIVVEKILTGEERLREDWPCQGTTGYEFLNDLESIFLDPAGTAAIKAAWVRLSRVPGVDRGFHGVAYRAKLRILRNSLRPDLRRLVRILQRLIQGPGRKGRVARTALFAALERVMAAFPVYRTYIEPGRNDGATSEDRRLAAETVDRVLADPNAPSEIVRFIGTVLQQDGWDSLSRSERASRAEFIERFQQTSGPGMAKGVEDTAFYQYVPLVSLNEVGGDPDRDLSRAVERLHGTNADRQAHWPQGLICTNTHDTKRSADLRARLDVLSEVPQQWIQAADRWRRMNRRHRGRAGRRVVPDPNTEYLFYQSVVGLWPLTPHHEGGFPGLPEDAVLNRIRERMDQYMLKAVREGKQRSTWTATDQAYEEELQKFIGTLLDPMRSRAWLSDVAAFVAPIQRPGLWNSLSRLVVHLTAPGTPDLYQGDELWNFTLVDPDNREPVDYDTRDSMLRDLDARIPEVGDGRADAVARLLESAGDGSIKLFLTSHLLRERRRRASLFREGSYRPLSAAGEHAGNVFAFAREGTDSPVISIVTRLSLSLMRSAAPAVGTRAWGSTTIILPEGLSGNWRCLFTGRQLSAEASLEVGSALEFLPVSVLVRT
jgi:(1->4)-alpha-D-glucan 1-alpha-D-glucosylmutase